MKKGFTLIELLVVVLIIGILSAIALPQYTTAVEKARAAEALTLMGSLRQAAQVYKLANNHYPTRGEMYDLDIQFPGELADAGENKKFITKNFEIWGAPTSSTSSAKYLIAAKRTNDTEYYLGVVMEPNGSAVRCCGKEPPTTSGCAAPDPGSQIAKMCNAITSGHNSDF